jgi:hypothetical protein
MFFLPGAGSHKYGEFRHIGKFTGRQALSAQALPGSLTTEDFIPVARLSGLLSMGKRLSQEAIVSPLAQAYDRQPQPQPIFLQGGMSLFPHNSLSVSRIASPFFCGTCKSLHLRGSESANLAKIREFATQKPLDCGTWKPFRGTSRGSSGGQAAISLPLVYLWKVAALQIAAPKQSTGTIY